MAVREAGCPSVIAKELCILCFPNLSWGGAFLIHSLSHPGVSFNDKFPEGIVTELNAMKHYEERIFSIPNFTNKFWFEN